MPEPTSPPPRIGSPEWDRERANIGLDRRWVDADVDAVLATADAHGDPDGLQDGHELRHIPSLAGGEQERQRLLAVVA
ncbi:hypothetical protein AB0L53_33785 [Nonomuraea sp. NPDC052129]|uniref:hypothetical protein n=1 Tax=Nonomuraea sp. NPDC052129 TaxID=3154651 RepID=UPI003446EC5A